MAEYAEESAVPSGWRTRQPGFTIWALLSVVRVSFVGFCYSIYYIPASFRQSPTWSYRQAIRSRLLKIAFGVITELGFTQSLNMEAGDLGDRWVIIEPASDEIYPGAFTSHTVKPEIIGATWYPDAPPKKVDPDDQGLIVLSFHSGGFLWLDGRPEDSGETANMLNSKLGPGTRSLWVQYRLAGGENPTPYPGPMQDAVTAYLYLVKDMGISPSRIILAGDSSGGTIAVALLRYLVSKENLDPELNDLQPRACLLFSPSVEYSFEGDSHAVHNHRNQKTDYCDGPMAAWGARAFAPPEIVRLDDPYLSPALYPFATPVPIFAQAGGAEMLCDSVRKFTEAMRAIPSNRIEYLETPDVPHDVYATGKLLGWPKEQEEMIDAAVNFAL
ncbi:alpha/beta-hydrolase [Penicillium sp. IBT 16267x]|nr:alpha/beta-hydrolase [Penicillium sp. IBT 16267x]